MESRLTSIATDQSWLAFITTLPTDEPEARMRILRMLESLGCALVREGVFVLPDSAQNRNSLAKLCDHVERIRGTAIVTCMTPLDEKQNTQLRNLFDRTHRYHSLTATIQGLQAGFGVSAPAAIARVLAKQRREFDAVSMKDFFPSEARSHAANALADAELKLRELMFPAMRNPPASAHSTTRYLGRQWATHKPLWADRLASGWLIRRFIDPEAHLIWLEKTEPCPADTVSYGFNGATFSSSQDRFTFEHLLTTFDLDRNTSLRRISTLIYSLEAGDMRVPEAAGVETLLQGARRRALSLDELFSESEKTFDLIYEAYLDATDEPD